MTGTTRGYLRISLDSPTSGSIKKQRDRILSGEAFRGRKPDAVQFYADEGVSGSKVAFADRPEGARLLRELRSGDRVVMTRIDRAARNVRDLLGLVKRIEDSGATIEFIDNEIDTSGNAGKFMLTILAAIAELEAGMISDRRTESLKAFTAEGRHAQGKAPYGFRSVENPNGRGLVIEVDPVTGPLLREAVARVVAGESQESVRHMLGMSKTGFNKLLRNPRLAGMTPVGDKGDVFMVNGLPRVVPSAALLTMTEWLELQATVGNKIKAWSKAEGMGHVFHCGVCGDRLYLNKSALKASYATYRCRAVKHEPGERTASITRHRADTYVEAKFLEWFGDQSELVLTVVSDDSAKREAVAFAANAEEVARRRIQYADPSDLQAAYAGHMAARAALDEAQRIPVTEETQHVATGRTYREAWEQGDDEGRERLVLGLGRFFVRPGRAAVADRLIWLSSDDLAQAESEGLSPVALIEREGVSWKASPPPGQSLSEIGASVRVDSP